LINTNCIQPYPPGLGTKGKVEKIEKLPNILKEVVII